MPPPRITKAFVNGAADAFIRDIARARDLYNKIVLNGYTSGVGGAGARPLAGPDTRDAAAFIFFEVAAKFEGFARTMFEAETRSKMRVTIAQSAFVMGDLDNGMRGKLGWGDPTRLKERGQHLFGADSFFGSLPSVLANPTYQHLLGAHAVRNRVAHAGPQATKSYVAFLATQNLGAAERKGMSVGRFLRDYPQGTPDNERFFFLFLRAYERFAERAKAKLP